MSEMEYCSRHFSVSWSGLGCREREESGKIGVHTHLLELAIDCIPFHQANLHQRLKVERSELCSHPNCKYFHLLPQEVSQSHK